MIRCKYGAETESERGWDGEKWLGTGIYGQLSIRPALNIILIIYGLLIMLDTKWSVSSQPQVGI